MTDTEFSPAFEKFQTLTVDEYLKLSSTEKSIVMTLVLKFPEKFHPELRGLFVETFRLKRILNTPAPQTVCQTCEHLKSERPQTFMLVPENSPMKSERPQTFMLVPENSPMKSERPQTFMLVPENSPFHHKI
jgi:hypothetical protein